MGYSAYLAGSPTGITPDPTTNEAEKKRKAAAEFGGRAISVGGISPVFGPTGNPNVQDQFDSTASVGDGAPTVTPDYGWGGQAAYNYNQGIGAGTGGGNVAANIGDSDFGSPRVRIGNGSYSTPSNNPLDPFFAAFSDNQEDFNTLTANQGASAAARARAYRNLFGGGNNVTVDAAQGPQFSDVFSRANQTVANDPLIAQRSVSLAEQGRRTGEGAGQQYMRSTGQGTGTAGGETQASVLRALGGLEGMEQATNFQLGQRGQFMDSIFGAEQAQANRAQQAALLQATLNNTNRQRMLDFIFGGGVA